MDKKKKHSRRFLIIKGKIPNENLTAAEIIDFLLKNNEESSKKVKVSFVLYWKQNKVNINKKICILPNPIIVEKKKILVIKSGLKEEEINSLKELKKDCLIFLEEDKIKDFFLKANGKLSKRKSNSIVKLFCHPSWEPSISCLKKELSAIGIYPSLKNGCLTDNILEKVQNSVLETGEQTIKVDKNGNINTLIGSSDMSIEKLIDNFLFLYKSVFEMKPNKWKGLYLKKVILSTSMGPGLVVKNLSNFVKTQKTLNS